ncbi:MAG: cyclase family protein [Actinobacteria bacterium]|nr:cyclase family protein [Actinomycetota bacterium]
MSELGLPRYDQLPEAEGGARCGWHVFGDDDQVGRINLQTADRVASAAGLVRSGEVFSLNAPIDVVDPPMFGRRAPRHTVIDEGTGNDFDDKLDDFNPQASSQWDSLAHVGYAPDVFYNGATTEDVRTGRRNTIEHWARRGIVGRGIVLDLEQLLGGAGSGFSPGDTHRVTVAELEAARERAGIEWRSGDVMILHTGYLAWYLRQDRSLREEIAAADGEMTAVGLDRGPEMLAYLWDSGIAAIGADNPGVEAAPFDLTPEAWPYGFLHHCLIGQLGIALGELWWLDDLARSCRADGRFEVLFTAAPSHVVGGIGSAANALAIK